MADSPEPEQEDWTPKPDPTVLTTDALRREIAGLEKLVDTKLEALEDLQIERFQSIDTLMERAEALRREQKADTNAAVAASLDAQKEATTKMEKSISDQLASLRSNFETSLKSVQSTIDDTKERVTILESVKVGQVEQRTETRAVSSTAIAVTGAALVLLNIIIGIILFMATRPPM